MRIKATVLNSTTNDNKIIQFDVNPKDVYRVMRMLYKGGFEVDYRKVIY
jgi:hypothetical protein